MPRTPTPTLPHHVEILADRTRHLICSILVGPDPPVSQRDLAVELATRRLGKPAADVTDDERRRQLIQLHHHHLPKLDDYGLVSYDRSTRTVSITATGHEALTATPGVSDAADYCPVEP